MLGDKTYVEGKFPGERQIAFQLFEPSKVTVSLFLERVAATGDETVLVVFEDRCRSRVRESITGKSMLQEFEQKGAVARTVDLTGIGDHLVQFSSDAQAKYVLKVDVAPLRLSTP